ncbi:uncharacterized protein LOC126371330 [Pectinophora gossypiella]|nr:uncharacterized protein LOC126371330 [Pectinophora gossypiella]
MLRYFCFLAVILGARSASAPFIKPCQTTDNACVVSSAQAAVPFIAPGIPELGVKSLDPMLLEEVRSDQGGLHLLFKNTVLTGMKGCSVDAVKMKNNKQTVTIRCSVMLKGDYTLSGQLLVLPVQGEGPYTIHIRDIVIKAFTEIETVPGADGKPHWNIAKWRHTFNVKTSTVFDFENLFNGNQILATPVAEFMNSNWRDVMQEVAGPIVHAIVSNVVDGVQALYKAVPVEELIVQ